MILSLITQYTAGSHFLHLKQQKKKLDVDDFCSKHKMLYNILTFLLDSMNKSKQRNIK